MGDKDQLEVRLSAQRDGVSYTKVFSFTKGSYEFDVKNTVKNQSGQDVKVLPNFSISVDKNSTAESGPVALKSYSLQDGPASGMPMARLYEGFASSSSSKNYQRLPISKIEKSKPSTIKGGWLAYQNGYFVAAIVMPENLSTKVGQSYQQNVGKDSVQQSAITVARSNVKVLQPGESYSDSSKLYTGPSDPSTLSQISPGLKLTVDYGFFWIIANLLHKAMVLVHQLGLSWGWSLVAVVVLLRLALFKQAKDQVKHTRAMNNAKPDLDAIEKKYENTSRFDQKRSEETLAVYKKHRINPATSCIMPLLNLPIYMATYSMVLASYEFKSQSLLWLSDLSVSDPYYIMPVLAGLGLLAQGRSMVPQDPAFKLVMNIMPLIFLFVMLNAPACVALYVALQMWIQVLQSKLIKT